MARTFRVQGQTLRHDRRRVPAGRFIALQSDDPGAPHYLAPRELERMLAERTLVPADADAPDEDERELLDLRWNDVKALIEEAADGADPADRSAAICNAVADRLGSGRLTREAQRSIAGGLARAELDDTTADNLRRLLAEH